MEQNRVISRNRLLTVMGDVSDETDCQRATETAEQFSGGINVCLPDTDFMSGQLLCVDAGKSEH